MVRLVNFPRKAKKKEIEGGKDPARLSKLGANRRWGRKGVPLSRSRMGGGGGKGGGKRTISRA